MANVLCVLYADPVDGYPPDYTRDEIPEIERYHDGQTTPTPDAIGFRPGDLLGCVSGELGGGVLGISRSRQADRERDLRGAVPAARGGDDQRHGVEVDAIALTLRHASLRISFNTPCAVTAGPAPGPMITSGFSRYRCVVNTNWLSVPVSDPSGLATGTDTSPTRTLRRVAIAR